MLASFRSVPLPERDLQSITGRKSRLEFPVELQVKSLPLQFILGIPRHIDLRIGDERRAPTIN